MSYQLAFVCTSALVLIHCSDANGPPPGDGNGDDGAEIGLEVVASGLSAPLYLTAPAGDDRLFVVEKGGRIRVIEDGQLRATPFLDIGSKVSGASEQGLLSMAFHPEYDQNGFFYVNYTDTNGDTQVERYAVTGDPNEADPSSAKPILEVGQPFRNHNGGLVVFGPDGMLYIGMGDGGSGGDPIGHGQNTGTRLGALLRIDVDGGDPYAIPPDNPFVGTSGADEIWAYGLRNPWRFAFDQGLLYVADVGQNAWEEVSVVPADEPGLNYGWNIMEGTHCFGSPNCDTAGLVIPVLEYAHNTACSISGGYVYRGADVPAIEGHYFYSDYCAGFLRSFRYEGGAAVEQRQWNVGGIGDVLSFGRDARGELYILSANGRVYRIVTGG